MIVRPVVAVLAATLVATQVVRNAAVLGLADTKPEAAARFWSSHPAVELSSAMTDIARATRDRRQIANSTFSILADAAAKEPLAPEPFLVRGVRAELSGDGATAQRAFEEAQWRDPRSLPAAYFLADRYFRVGDLARGLREIATLARLSPGGSAALSPYLAEYAKNSANWPSLRSLFRANPELADPALVALASSMATVPAVIALADPHRKALQAPWLPALVKTLTDAGQYARAHAIWANVAGVRVEQEQLIFDETFSDKVAPPPFNWTLTSSAVGLAEREPGRRLHVIFYGQEDGILASQLLLLPAGDYRLSMRLLGDPARARILNWSIWCDKAAAPVASVSLDGAAAHAWRFAVPAGCPAQWLKLSGSSSDIAQQVDLTIAGLKLERTGPGA
jgi:hypothetical protein